jgi:tetratricopeptide (TPR) repeat protein
MANFQQQEYAQAVRSLAAAIESNPNDARAHYSLGRVLWAQGGAGRGSRCCRSGRQAVTPTARASRPPQKASTVWTIGTQPSMPAV